MCMSLKPPHIWLIKADVDVWIGDAEGHLLLLRQLMSFINCTTFIRKSNLASSDIFRTEGIRDMKNIL